MELKYSAICKHNRVVKTIDFDKKSAVNACDICNVSGNPTDLWSLLSWAGINYAEFLRYSDETWKSEWVLYWQEIWLLEESKSWWGRFCLFTNGRSTFTEEKVMHNMFWFQRTRQSPAGSALLAMLEIAPEDSCCLTEVYWTTCSREEGTPPWFLHHRLKEHNVRATNKVLHDPVVMNLS